MANVVLGRPRVEVAQAAGLAADNAVERALIVWPAGVLEPQAFPERIAAAAGSVVTLGGPHTLEEVEREHTLRVMASAPTLDEAAKVLGIDASTLWRKRKKYESGV